MKAFNIVGIILSLLFFCITGYYVAEVAKARFDFLYSDVGYYNGYVSNNSGALTTEIGVWSLLFFLFFLMLFIFNLIKVKTKTSKVFSIIGLSFTVIFFLWNTAMLISPSSISFDEVGGGWIFYSLIMFAFSIVGLVQAVRYVNRVIYKKTTEIDDLLDR